LYNKKNQLTQQQSSHQSYQQQAQQQQYSNQQLLSLQQQQQQQQQLVSNNLKDNGFFNKRVTVSTYLISFFQILILKNFLFKELRLKSTNQTNRLSARG
jgi:hypothetical protein